MTGSKSRKCVILGAGGHARLVIDAVLAADHSDAEVVAVVDSDRSLWETEVLGISVIGGDDQLAHLVDQGVLYFLLGVGSSKNTDLKRKLYDLGLKSGFRALSARHPAAVCSALATLGEGVQLMANSIIGPGARLGSNVAVNAGAVVEHDCQIGDNVFIGTGAVVCGGVEVGEGAFIGAGATVRQMVKIGSNSVLGAGCVVVSDVPAGMTVVGVPAKPIRVG